MQRKIIDEVTWDSSFSACCSSFSLCAAAAVAKVHHTANIGNPNHSQGP